MAVYAHCGRCHRYHRRGTKIWNEHKEYLGMYLDTSTGSRRRKNPVSKPFLITMDRQGNITIKHDHGSKFLQFESDKDLVFDILKKSENDDLLRGWPITVFSTQPRASILEGLFSSKNPGTKWHVDRANDLRREMLVQQTLGHSTLTANAQLMAQENDFAAQASRERGMNPSILCNPRGTCPICHEGRLNKGGKYISCPVCRVSWKTKSGRLHRNPIRRGWQYGDRVKVKPDRMGFGSHFGTVIGIEDEYLRIKFDEPVDVKGVGLVRDDLFMPYTVRKVYERRR